MNADLRRQIHDSVRDLKRMMADVGGANAPEMKAAGSVLAKSIRRQLNRRTMHQGPVLPGEKRTQGASAPGEAPNRQTGRLYRSIGQEVVGGVRRVGSGWFSSRLLEGGVDAVMKPRRKKGAKRRARGALAELRDKARLEGRGRLVIAPRPFMQRALDAALPEMDGVMVTELQRRTAKPILRAGGG